MNYNMGRLFHLNRVHKTILVLGYASCIGETLINGLLSTAKEIVAIDARISTMFHFIDGDIYLKPHNLSTLKEIFALANFDCVYSFSYTDENVQFNQIEAEELANEKGICFIPIITKHVAVV